MRESGWLNTSSDCSHPSHVLTAGWSVEQAVVNKGGLGRRPLNSTPFVESGSAGERQESLAAQIGELLNLYLRVGSRSKHRCPGSTRVQPPAQPSSLLRKRNLAFCRDGTELRKVYDPARTPSERLP
jgi:hypothetical protein